MLYLQGRICAVKYLFALFNFRMTKLLGGLLRPLRIKVNCIRFCLLTVIAELLTVDFLLFVYLESNSPCLKFFELISTVCIIPILLSWLMELKSSAQKRKNAESETEKLWFVANISHKVTVNDYPSLRNVAEQSWLD